MTGGRIKRVQKYIGDETFMMTYGDGVCDVNIQELVKFHGSHGKIATLTAVIQEQSKGVLDISGDGSVRSFREKRTSDSFLINAGYMVLNPEVFNYIDCDSVSFEKEPLEAIAAQRQLMSYTHKGFWQCMDTKSQKNEIEMLIASNQAPWMVWENNTKIIQKGFFNNVQLKINR